MCLMHEAEPYGSMLVNGKRINKVQMEALVGIPEKECSALMLELEGAGVFSRDPDGTLYSRRMRRDHVKAETGKTHATKGWEQRKAKGIPDDKSDGSPNGIPNGSPN